MRALLTCVLLLAACGSSVGPGGHTVGAACASDANCDHRCVIGSHYPNGMCMLTCASTADCPGGTACVDDNGGICAILCTEVGGNCAQVGGGY